MTGQEKRRAHVHRDHPECPPARPAPPRRHRLRGRACEQHKTATSIPPRSRAAVADGKCVGASVTTRRRSAAPAPRALVFGAAVARDQEHAAAPLRHVRQPRRYSRRTVARRLPSSRPQAAEHDHEICAPCRPRYRIRRREGRRRTGEAHDNRRRIGLVPVARAGASGTGPGVSIRQQPHKRNALRRPFVTVRGPVGVLDTYPILPGPRFHTRSTFTMTKASAAATRVSTLAAHRKNA